VQILKLEQIKVTVLFVSKKIAGFTHEKSPQRCALRANFIMAEVLGLEPRSTIL